MYGRQFIDRSASAPLGVLHLTPMYSSFFVNSKPLWRQLMTVRQHKMMDEPSEKTWITQLKDIRM